MALQISEYEIGDKKTQRERVKYLHKQMDTWKK